MKVASPKGIYGVLDSVGVGDMTSPQSTNLTATEQQDLRRLEETIRKAQKAAITEAQALLEIRSRRLYRQTHESFEDYSLSKWRISRCHAYRLCDWATIVKNLVSNGDSYPVRESYARPLARLTAEQQRQAWHLVQQRHSQGFEASDIESIAEEVSMTPTGASIAGDHRPPGRNPRHADPPARVIRQGVGSKRVAGSPISWFGAKTTLANRIVSLMPAHTTYVEPFFGGGSVLFAKPPSSVEIVNDVNQSVVNFFSVLRDEVMAEKLCARLRLTPYSREEHRRCMESAADPVEDARRFFVRVRQSYAGIEGTSWSLGFGEGANRADTFANIVDDLPIFVERLRRVQVECRDALDFLGNCDRKETLIYLDPPYVPETRTGKGDKYRHEMTTEAHEVMLKAIAGMKRANVMISGYDNALYARFLGGWNRHDWPMFVNAAKTEAGGAKAERTESLWCNF
jgi:DNA adenine methylase